MNLIRENPKPSFTEDMVLLLRAGRTVPIDPATLALLTATGIWDQRPFLKLIQDRAFGLIITQDDGGFTREIANAIDNRYPLVEHIGFHTVRRPSEP